MHYQISEIVALSRRPALALALAFVILVGATPLGEINGRAGAVMLILGTGVVWLGFTAVRRSADLSDQLAFASYSLMLVAAIMSSLPRQSIDIAYSALALLGLFWFARRELADPRSRSWLLNTFTVMSAVVGIAALISWGSDWIGWTSRAGTLPPELALTSFVFGNVHDVVILVLLLAPAALARRGRWRTPIALAVMVIGAGVLFLDPSRNIILASVIATAAVATVSASRVGRLREWGWLRLTLIAGLIGVGVVLAAWTGALDRVLNPDTLGIRLRLWSASFDIWRADPISGAGPGTFPWMLPLTDYFAATDFTPRHPDSALAQLVAEAGVIGVGAAGAAIAAVLLGIRRRPSLSAIWALTFYLSCGLFANPTDFGFLVVPAVLWAALLTFRGSPGLESRSNNVLQRRRLDAVLLVVGGIALIGAVSFQAAHVLYDDARDQLASGNAGRSLAGLRAAAAIDPSLGLYQREIGALLLVEGDREGAIDRLERAIEAVPSDAAALRLLAVAARESDASTAHQAASTAADQNPRQPANLLVLASVTAAQGDDATALALLSEALTLTPWASGTLDLPGLGIRSRLDGAVRTAVEEWASGGFAATQTGMEPAWLVALAGGDQHRVEAIRAAGGVSESANALVDVFDCRFGEAQTRIRNAEANEKRWLWYWTVRYVVENLSGEVSEETRWFLSHLGGLTPGSAPLAAPTSHNDRLDLWGYGRRPFQHAEIIGVPESGRAGLHEWMRDPIGTAVLLGLDRPIHSCSRPDS